jgi:aminopeptidase N
MPTGSEESDWTLLSGGGLAYGRVSLDAQTIGFLTRSVQTLEEPLARAAAVTSLWDAMLDGHVPPATILNTLLSSLAVETNELVLQLLLDQVRQVFWRFMAPDARLDAAVRLESALRQGLDQAATTSARSALFATLRSVALTPACVEWLEAIWSRTRYIDGLPLSDVDEAGIALDLALRLPERADAIVMTQASRTSSGDWRARLAFIAPAVSPEQAERARFAESLGDPDRRRRETWVLAAVRCLHHPLRAVDSAPLVRPALVLLRDIQRTGDIFFPKRWTDAILSGHQSPTVADDVRHFIAELPSDYPPRLRLILQTAADPLFRAARLIGH